MRLTNTLTGKLEELRPLTEGKLGVYVCGVTPYEESHIGHAMSAIIYDVLVRYLRWEGNSFGGLEVTYVSNYTDIDDKLIARGRELGRDPIELAHANIEQWEQEQHALNLDPPDKRPRVTEHIPMIIAQIEAILAHDHAYVTAAGDVYYRVRSQPDYGKLSHRDIEQLRSGTRFEPGEDKEFPLDFALWKAKKEGEPAWPSPWGEGRPGWHIECSAMSQHYLGERFDIHGGGLDLVFPHHENEIAQAEAATGPGSPLADARMPRPFAQLWLHNGLVQRDGEKMSKSLGNVVSVREALDPSLLGWSADALRLFVLNSHYRSPSNLTDEAVTAATRGVERLAGALAGSRHFLLSELGQHSRITIDHGHLDASGFRARFVEAMEDNLGTPGALAAMFDLARAINRGDDVREAQATLRELADVLGLSLREQADGAELDAVELAKLADSLDVACSGTDAASTIDALLARREEARGARDFAVADAIRDGLAEAGVQVEDTSEGPRWSAGR